ncbi:dctR protein [Escherichia coli]|nr:dctR protein [Escherichia coli]EFO3133888.1 dctR protein [Escherichia coli O109]EGE3162059.1 dctR protein [Escherichia coli]PAS83898.1 dctR protein [Escherichia coli]HAJ7556627.1 dctR protein [Escherichia coli]
MYYIKLIYSKLTIIIIISPVLLITFGKLIIKLMSAPGVGYVSYNYQGYDVLHRDEKHSE